MPYPTCDFAEEILHLDATLVYDETIPNYRPRNKIDAARVSHGYVSLPKAKSNRGILT